MDHIKPPPWYTLYDGDSMDNNFSGPPPPKPPLDFSKNDLPKDPLFPPILDISQLTQFDTPLDDLLSSIPSSISQGLKFLPGETPNPATLTKLLKIVFDSLIISFLSIVNTYTAQPDNYVEELNAKMAQISNLFLFAWKLLHYLRRFQGMMDIVKYFEIQVKSREKLLKDIESALSPVPETDLTTNLEEEEEES